MSEELLVTDLALALDPPQWLPSWIEFRTNGSSWVLWSPDYKLHCTHEGSARPSGPNLALIAGVLAQGVFEKLHPGRFSGMVRREALEARKGSPRPGCDKDLWSAWDTLHHGIPSPRPSHAR